MNKFMKKLMKKDGFTLVELIVVIAILAILAGVAIPAYSGYITKAQDAAVVTELDAIKTAAQGANAAHGEISKIVVETVNDKTEITVYGASGLAEKFGKDFEMYYGGNAGAADDKTGAVVITIDEKILDGSYAEGATWENDEWGANCDHDYKSVGENKNKHVCGKCDREDACVDANTDAVCDTCGGSYYTASTPEGGEGQGE